MARQISIRGVSEELGKRLHRLGRDRGQSVNTVILNILKSAVGISDRRQALTRYTTWTQEDLAEFDDALRDQRTIDEGMWR